MSSLKRALSTEEKNEFIGAMTEELAPLRIRAGITQGELANILGVSRQTYSAVETGRSELSWSTYLSLVWFLIVIWQRRTTSEIFPHIRKN